MFFKLKDSLYSNITDLTDSEYIAAEQIISFILHSNIKKNRESIEFLYNPVFFKEGQTINMLATSLCFQFSCDSDEYQPHISQKTLTIDNNKFTLRTKMDLADLAPLSKDPLEPPQAGEMIRRKLSEYLPDNSFFYLHRKIICRYVIRLLFGHLQSETVIHHFLSIQH